jgi:hypothetical protein
MQTRSRLFKPSTAPLLTCAMGKEPVRIKSGWGVKALIEFLPSSLLLG